MENVATIKEETKPNKKDPFLKRIHEVDLLRGFLIILVIIDHFMFCFHDYLPKWFGETNGLYQFAKFYLNTTARNIIQPLCLLLFCFISGVSCSFSRNNRKRGIVAVIIAVILAVVTNLVQWILGLNGIEVMIRIDINIIGALAISILVFSFMEKRSYRVILAAILISFLISSYISPMLRGTLLKQFGGFTITRPGVSYGELGTPAFYMPLFWEYPYMADFVPLFPYIMFFLIGTLFSYFVYKNKMVSLFPKRGNWERPICFLGRHTMIIYLSHFIIIRGVFIIIDLIVTGGVF